MGTLCREGNVGALSSKLHNLKKGRFGIMVNRLMLRIGGDVKAMRTLLQALELHEFVPDDQALRPLFEIHGDVYGDAVSLHSILPSSIHVLWRWLALMMELERFDTVLHIARTIAEGSRDMERVPEIQKSFQEYHSEVVQTREAMRNIVFAQSPVSRVGSGHASRVVRSVRSAWHVMGHAQLELGAPPESAYIDELLEKLKRVGDDGIAMRTVLTNALLLGTAPTAAQLSSVALQCALGEHSLTPTHAAHAYTCLMDIMHSGSVPDPQVIHAVLGALHSQNDYNRSLRILDILQSVSQETTQIPVKTVKWLQKRSHASLSLSNALETKVRSLESQLISRQSRTREQLRQRHQGLGELHCADTPDRPAHVLHRPPGHQQHGATRAGRAGQRKQA
eukprot:9976_1